MANNKKNEAITARDVDFAKWYTDVCRKAELMDYSGVKGFIIYRPYGYALWEQIQSYMDKKFKEAGIEVEFKGEGVNEKGYNKATGEVLIEVDPKYFRPAEVETLLGDPTKAKTVLGWNPTKTTFPELVKIMMQHDMEYVKHERHAHSR